MASTIGIKLANGEFYPVLEENSQGKKRLVLTTVHNDQRSIQIDLYRSSSRSMTDALYIGSLVMDKIGPKPKGQPSIEFIVASSTEGNITANAIDLDGGVEGRQTLSVSLKSLDEVRQDSVITNFELDDMVPPTGLYEPVGEVKIKKSWLPKVIVIAIILILVLFALWFLFIRSGSALSIISCIRQAFQKPQASEQIAAVSLPPPPPAAPASQPAAPAAQAPPAAPVEQAAAQAQPAAPAEPAAQPPPATPMPVIQAPAEPPASVQVSRTRPAPPVASYNVPSVIPSEGVLYRVRYGDTLWDISAAFYRNPWLYPRIARFNNIRNPDRIISGTTIRVPPRN